MNQKAAFAKIRSLGCTVARTDADEFRVNVRGGSEATAYYTTDLEDAVATASAIAEREAFRARRHRPARDPAQILTEFMGIAWR